MTEEIERLCLRLSALAQWANLPMAVLDPNGNAVESPDYFEKSCAFCRIMGGCAQGAERCRRFRMRYGRMAAQTGECAVARCPAGLVALIAPVLAGEECAGYVTCGPMILWDWDDETLSEILTMTQDLPLSQEALIAAGRLIPKLETKRVNALAELLRMTVSFREAGSLERRLAQAQQQKVIAEYVQERKQTPAKSYPLRKEYELVARVREGNRTAAKAILNDLLGEIFFSNAGETEVIKARVIELVVVVSRAAVESGASLDKLLALNNRVVVEINGLKDFESLCMGVVQVLDEMIDTLYQTRDTGSRSILQILTYVKDHYAEPLTLESVAKHVYLSPYYVSHLFREEMDLTFVEYLTRVRMEQAKGLLRLPGVTVRSVAGQVGMTDAGYFAKVFRRYTGLTPTQFQQAQAQ